MASALINPKFIEMIQQKFEKDKTSNQNRFYLPFKSIEDMPVDIYIKGFVIDGIWKYYYIIELEEVYRDQDDCENYHLFCSETLTDLTLLLQDLIYFMENYVVDKYHGRLVLKEKAKYDDGDLMAEFCKLFEKNEKIKMTIAECCVCYATTTTATRESCNHPLCICCVAQIPVVQNEGDCYIKNCPMCREEICEFY